MNALEARLLLEAATYRNEKHDVETLLELLSIVAEEDKDGDAYAEIGGIYYGQKKYDLALKYYSIALEYGEKSVHSGLGYIWYYGRTGQKDYKKAYYHFEKASKLFVYDNKNNIDVIRSYYAIEATSKLADMYKNGYYVEKDYEEYKRLIIKLYNIVNGYNYPEIYTRMASILEEDGNLIKATELRKLSVECLAKRLKYNRFFGDYNRMNWCINDIYRTNEFDEDNMQLWDLYYILKEPCNIYFSYAEEHEITSVTKGEHTAVRFDNNWYRSIDDFMQKAEIEGVPLAVIADRLHDWRIVSDN